MVVDFMRQREYLKAMDAYVKVTIGNAAWPIGVTSVGIHERGGREKISDTNKEWQAHIMSDETTRKYLVSLKVIYICCFESIEELLFLLRGA